MLPIDADRLRALMHARHLSAVDLARLAGIGKATVRRFLRGGNEAMPGTASGLAAAPGVQPGDLTSNGRPLAELVG